MKSRSLILESNLDIARKWASLLDVEAFDELPAMLHPECEYGSPKGVVLGAQEIVDTYLRNAVWAHETFDYIAWESEIAPESDGRIRITFIDKTRHRGVDHVYRCQQYIHIDENGRIDRIEHEAIESEEKALKAFFDRVGVRRSG